MQDNSQLIATKYYKSKENYGKLNTKINRLCVTTTETIIYKWKI